MFSFDLTTAFIIIAALMVLFLMLDLVFAGGGMTSGMMGAVAQCGAAAMGGPYGWMLIVAIVIVMLAVFGILFGVR